MLNEESAVAAGDAAALASCRARAGAFGADVLIGLGAVASLSLVAWSTVQGDWLWWVCVATATLILLAIAINRLVLPSITGWTLGRALFGIVIVRRDGGAVGRWRLLARTEARQLERKPLVARRITAIAALVCAGVAVLAAAFGYATVCRHDLRLAQAREQLADRGPELVTDMLSYHTTTLRQDFDRAKSVVTDNYRPQLEQQQAAILQAAKTPVVDNVYWSTNASVLTFTENRGTMLVFLQGQRGTAPDMRTITATVKTDFERVSDSTWKLASLTVLAKPQPSGGGR